MKELLTHSRQDAFKTCRKKHFFSYEIGLRRIDDAKALRMGKAFHDGIEQLGTEDDLSQACAAVRGVYANMPGHFDAYEWAIEAETILRLVCAYQWRWRESKIENIKTEFVFQLPLINPATGKPTPIFDVAGKIDGIVKLEDGRLAVKETKTMGEDIGPDSPLWRRLRMDHQISLYIHAARQVGFPVDTVLYDVVRKPSISASPIPLLDGDGRKIVLDVHGERVRNIRDKSWKQSADAENGYVVQTRRMTPDEWGEKLTADIVSRPDFYFARVEIPRLDADVEEYQHELWEIQQAIHEAQKTGRHYRTVGRNTCQFCPYFDLCSTNQQIDPACVPEGFEILRDPHPELERNRNVNCATETASVSSTESIAASSANGPAERPECYAER